MTKPFTKVSAQQITNSLARKFIPLADSLRDLLTSFGVRQHIVRIVRIHWSGATRGVGTPQVAMEMVLEPTPKISDLSTLTEIIQPIGMDEVGAIVLSNVSGRYTEEQLRGFDPDGTEIPPMDEVFYEIEFPRVDNLPTVKRRFELRSAPYYKPGSLQWMLRLEKSNDDRERNGDPG